MFLSQGSNCFEKCFLEAMHAEFHMSVWLMELKLYQLPSAAFSTEAEPKCRVLSQKFQILEKQFLNCLSCPVGYTFHTDFHSDMRHIMAKCHVVGQNLTSSLYIVPKWQAAPSVIGIIFLSRVVGLHLWHGLCFSSVRGCDSPHAFWGNWLEN